MWQSLRQVCEDRAPSRVVLVHGLAGCGKSSLIHDTLRVSMDVTFFGTGKFDQMTQRHQQRPYSAFADAFSMLLKSVQDQLSKGLRVQIQKALGDDAWALVALAPPLAQILSDKATEQQPQSSSNNNYSSFVTSLDRSLSLFRKLLRAIASSEHPVVLFLDDLQWADPSSLDLLSYLVQDPHSQNVLFVGSYRYNQLEDEASLSQRLQDRLLPPNPDTYHILRLEDLDFESVNQLISDAVDGNVEIIERLTAIVFHKTQGNCFFIVQFLGFLQDERYLYYSPTTYQWEYDLDAIVEGTHDFANVEELVRTRIQRLDRSTQTVLQVAGFLGFVFDPVLLSHVVMAQDPSTTAPQISHNLYLLDRAGLLEKGPSSTFQFVHDHIQQSAYYSLVPNPHDRDDLHLRIGKILQQKWKQSKKKCNDTFFAMVDQLNQGYRLMGTSSDRLDLIQLNIQAAAEAKRRCDFLAAASYVEKGLKLLDKEELWTQEYELTLALYSFSTEFYLCSGNLDKCQESASEVLQHARTLSDRLRAHYTLVQALGSNGYIEEAILEGLRVLHRMGHDFPKHPTKQWHVLPEISKTRKWLRKFSDDTLLQLPWTTVEEDVIAVKLMTSLAFYLATTKEGEHLWPMLTCRVMQVTVKSGLSAFSPYAFAAYAATLATQQGKGRDESKHYASLALQLLDKSKSDEMTPAVLYILHSCVMHWQDPFNCSLDPLLSGYRIGLRTGNYDHAVACANSYAIVYYNSGWDLRMLERDLRAFATQAMAFRQHFALASMAAIRQLALNLLGRAQKNPLVLTGDAMNQLQALEDAVVHKNAFNLAIILRARLELAYLLNSNHLEVWLDDFDQGESRIGAGHAGYIRQSFVVGLCYLRLSRLGPKYRRRAKAQMALMEKWYKTDGNNNCYHMHLLFQAEWYALKLNPDVHVCMEMYNRAIQAAARGGYTHDEAVATERAADVCAMLYQWTAAEAYYTECYRLYKQWGATAKVDQLLSLHNWLRKSLEEAEEQRSTTSSANSRNKAARRQHRRVSGKQVVKIPSGSSTSIASSLDGSSNNHPQHRFHRVTAAAPKNGSGSFLTRRHSSGQMESVSNSVLLGSGSSHASPPQSLHHQRQHHHQQQQGTNATFSPATSSSSGSSSSTSLVAGAAAVVAAARRRRSSFGTGSFQMQAIKKSFDKIMNQDSINSNNSSLRGSFHFEP